MADPGPVFAALADPTRRAILERVAATGDATPTALAADLPVTRQAVAKHLASLEQAGLVSGRRVGREHRYAPSAAPLAEAAQWMARVGGEWDERLARLGRAAARRAG
ncbi:MAG TPA: metalloregulator ArsR/SmtB family transcription factor [Solirubrobacteraceae bacterium]